MDEEMEWRRELRWRPRQLPWRTAALFMVGSFCFALGSFPPYAELMDPRAVGITFVIGSLFFTSAGYHQFLEAINDPSAPGATPGRFRFVAWQPRSILFWATLVQLAGTLFFNFNTIDAMIATLDAQEANRLVWGPDFFGSIAFLVASHLAWLDVNKRTWAVHRNEADWWVAALNYVGSIFFMMSALASFTLTTTGEMLNITIVNLGTFLGAVCFFIGAYLLLPPAPHRPHRTGRPEPAAT